MQVSLKQTWAEHGEHIVSTLSTQLMKDYGKSFGLRSIRRMIQFSNAFLNFSLILATLSQELTQEIDLIQACNCT